VPGRRVLTTMRFSVVADWMGALCKASMGGAPCVHIVATGTDRDINSACRCGGGQGGRVYVTCARRVWALVQQELARHACSLLMDRPYITARGTAVSARGGELSDRPVGGISSRWAGRGGQGWSNVHGRLADRPADQRERLGRNFIVENRSGEKAGPPRIFGPPRR